MMCFSNISEIMELEPHEVPLCDNCWDDAVTIDFRGNPFCLECFNLIYKKDEETNW
jgi:hypothetical protein